MEVNTDKLILHFYKFILFCGINAAISENNPTLLPAVQSVLDFFSGSAKGYTVPWELLLPGFTFWLPMVRSVFLISEEVH